MRTCASVRDLAVTGKQCAVAHDMVTHAFVPVAVPDPKIQAWQGRLDLNPAQVRQLARLLSRDEQLRSRKYHFERDRRRFIVARGMLRILLGSRLNIAPEDVRLSYTQFGKPILARAESRIHFNLSHCEERALFALSPTRRLGVDIEYVKRAIDAIGVARRFFTGAETAALEALPESRRRRAFMDCWTRKEAVVKALGAGFSLPFDQFEVSIAPGAVPRVLAFTSPEYAVESWALHSVKIGREFAATIAAFWGYPGTG